MYGRLAWSEASLSFIEWVSKEMILDLLQNYLLKHLVDSRENTDGTNVTFTGKVRVFFTEGENLCFLTVVRDAAVVDPVREL